MRAGKKTSALLDMRESFAEVKRNEAIEQVLKELPDYPSPVPVSKYLDLINIQPENSFDASTWTDPKIKSSLLKALVQSEDQKPGIRKCLATAILKPKFPVLPKRIKLAAPEDLIMVVAERLTMINNEIRALEIAGDDTENFKQSLDSWSNLLRAINGQIQEQDLRYLEELIANLDELAQSSAQAKKIHETTDKLEALLVYFYSKLYFPGIRLRRSSTRRAA